MSAAPKIKEGFVKYVVFLCLLFSGCVGQTCKDGPTPDPGSNAKNLPACEYQTECPHQSYCPSFALDDGEPAFDSFQQAEINRAFDDWQISLGGVVDFDSAKGCAPFTIVRTDSNEAAFKTDGDPSPELDRGFESGTNVYINSDRTCGVWIFGDVIRHEIGHMLGLTHFGTKHAVRASDEMYFMYNNASPASVSVGDAIQYEDTHSCCARKK